MKKGQQNSINNKRNHAAHLPGAESVHERLPKDVLMGNAQVPNAVGLIP
jgi:hypothetical protein